MLDSVGAGARLVGGWSNLIEGVGSNAVIGWDVEGVKVIQNLPSLSTKVFMIEY